MLSARYDVSLQDAVSPAERPGTGESAAYNLVQALDRAISIIEELAAAPKGLTIGELCERLDMHKATVYRLLSTLVYRGYVEEDLRTAVYRLNLKVFDLAKKVLRSRSLWDEAQPVLERLRKRTKEDVGLAVIDRHELVVAPNEENLLAVTMRQKADGLQPRVLHAAARKLLLVDLPEHERHRVITSLTSEELASLGSSSGGELQSFLDLVQLQGFVIDDRLSGSGVRCVAAPVRNYLGEVIAVIGISTPIDRTDMGRLLTLARETKSAADSLSGRLCYEPSGT